jgi:acetylornithine deacetylase/succinyl-diaminopimelate desuccinylase family protein
MKELSTSALLKQLVEIPSVNPVFSKDPDIRGEARLADFVGRFLAERAFSVERHEVLEGRPNIVGRFGPARPAKTILLESHLDTQGVEGMTVKPFGAEVSNGRLYGRGACDTKGPMAAALAALEPAVLSALAGAGCQLVFVAAIGEEKGNLGAEQLVDAGLGADEAVILEPTEGAIVHAHKGTLWFEVETRGRAAHGSNPGLGRNAIEGMARALGAIREVVDLREKDARHPLLGRASLNIGMIRGGTAINIVPDRCVAEIDHRTLPGDDHDGKLRAMRQALDALRDRGAIEEFDLRVIKDGHPFETDPESALIRRLAACCSDVLGASRCEGAAWFSDAGPFSRTCAQVAVFGPGSIAQAHTADEYIELDRLEEGREIFRRFLLRTAGETGGRGAA